MIYTMKWMLPKRTYQWECKANEKISLYEHSNECIEVNAYLTLIMRWEIIYWAMMSSYNKLDFMSYEFNVMELYTKHR